MNFSVLAMESNPAYLHRWMRAPIADEMGLELQRAAFKRSLDSITNKIDLQTFAIFIQEELGKKKTELELYDNPREKLIGRMLV